MMTHTFGRIVSSALVLCTLALLLASSAGFVFAVEPVTTAAPISGEASAVAPTTTSEAPKTGADGITPFESMMYNVITNAGNKVAIVGGFLSESTPLPAKVEVGVPKDAAVFWVGEVNGTTDQGGDVELPQNKRTEGNFDIYTATMTRTRSIQVEYTLTQDLFASTGADSWAGTLSYTPLTDVAQVALAAELPANATVTDANFVLQGTGGSGGNIYLREMGEAKAGQEISTQLAYTTVAAPAQTASTGSSSTTTILIVIIVALIAVVAFLLLSRRMNH
jgi:LPXTG-motif cell wall-anchored protein